VRAEVVKSLARGCGFELAGVTGAVPLSEAAWYLEWVSLGMAGEMSYLTGHRAAVRRDPRALLPSAKSMICVGKLYNGPQPYSVEFREDGKTWISRYAWGEDYHRVVRVALRRLARKLLAVSPQPFEWRVCVDTAPLMERAYARRAGLGWIGKNSCLINQQMGSWFFLGELLVSFEIEPEAPPPGRCGSCTRCIDACPTAAIVPSVRPGGPSHTVDSRRCVSYLTIELRGAIPEPLRAGLGRSVFGCDICQDVCPWNRKAPVTVEPAFAAKHFAPRLEALAGMSEAAFARMFRGSAVERAGHRGFLRNVGVALANSGLK
jgi:epoxyqueuosine reductase